MPSMSIERNVFAAPAVAVNTITGSGKERSRNRRTSITTYVSKTGDFSRSFRNRVAEKRDPSRARLIAHANPIPIAARAFPMSNIEAYTTACAPMKPLR